VKCDFEAAIYAMHAAAVTASITNLVKQLLLSDFVAAVAKD
jgi:hypothetical protein